MSPQSTKVKPAPSDADTLDVPAEAATETWVLFSIEEQTYGLDMWEVERIVRSVEVKPLPETPPHVRGVVNVQGRVLPVIDLRVRFGHEPRSVSLSDHFLISRVGDVSVVLSVDATLGSRDVASAEVPPDTELPRCVRKVIPLDQGMVYALDMSQVLYGDESPTDSQLASILRELQTT